MERYLLLILIVTPGVITADQIEPNIGTNIIKKEDDRVTLSCSYDTSSSDVTLYWYRQYPNTEPQYLIWKDARSSSGTGTPSDRRFQSTTSQTSTELIINGVTLSDSALYYCALWNPVIQSLCASFGNEITPESTEEFAVEGSIVKLSCSYSTAQSLQWYRQYPRRAPEYLVLIIEGVKDNKKSDVDPRFSTKLRKEKQKQVDLEISSAAVTDSALYYCALVPTVTGN
ncbi:uncharacterized protein LOC127645127 [Xyrauchen texanus]|uniref:uncharacterized protein LOC127645127 n=1 Tax=Xyrauchen texanus TaxID=154827 RepID=UPI002242772D|nr:uncharacterized protein LOC127645127 [Xyrauchen texanus]